MNPLSSSAPTPPPKPTNYADAPPPSDPPPPRRRPTVPPKLSREIIEADLKANNILPSHEEFDTPESPDDSSPPPPEVQKDLLRLSEKPMRPRSAGVRSEVPPAAGLDHAAQPNVQSIGRSARGISLDFHANDASIPLSPVRTSSVPTSHRGAAPVAPNPLPIVISNASISQSSSSTQDHSPFVASLSAIRIDLSSVPAPALGAKLRTVCDGVRSKKEGVEPSEEKRPEYSKSGSSSSRTTPPRSRSGTAAGSFTLNFRTLCLFEMLKTKELLESSQSTNSNASTSSLRTSAQDLNLPAVILDVIVKRCGTADADPSKNQIYTDVKAFLSMSIDDVAHILNVEPKEARSIQEHVLKEIYVELTRTDGKGESVYLKPLFVGTPAEQQTMFREILIKVLKGESRGGTEFKEGTKKGVEFGRGIIAKIWELGFRAAPDDVKRAMNKELESNGIKLEGDFAVKSKNKLEQYLNNLRPRGASSEVKDRGQK